MFFYRTSRSFWRVGLSFFKRPLLSSSGLRATTRPSSAERTPPWTKRTPGFAPCPLPRGEPPSERCRESTTCSPAFRSLVRGGNKLKKNNYNRMFSLASCRFINVLGKCLTQRRTQTSPWSSVLQRNIGKRNWLKNRIPVKRKVWCQYYKGSLMIIFRFVERMVAFRSIYCSTSILSVWNIRLFLCFFLL